MKKITLFIAVFFATMPLFSQTWLDTAVDFTETDASGVEHNLFDILDAGQYVVIDFFYTTWVGCIETAPYIAEAYKKYGCNTADVFIMSISSSDNNSQCLSFDSQYGIEFPTISGIEGHGSDICNTYSVHSFPTYILIAPDHSIVETNMWPITKTEDFDPFFTAHHINESSCSTEIYKQELNNVLSVYPNPSTGIFNLDINYTGQVNIKVNNILGITVLNKQIYVDNNSLENINLLNNNDGIYFVTINTKEYSIVKKIELKK